MDRVEDIRDDHKGELAKLLVSHRRCVWAGFGSGEFGYKCVCGQRLKSNSHHVLARHQAEVISQWGRGQ